MGQQKNYKTHIRQTLTFNTPKTLLIAYVRFVMKKKEKDFKDL
jgi:hypothetical protein